MSMAQRPRTSDDVRASFLHRTSKHHGRVDRPLVRVVDPFQDGISYAVAAGEDPGFAAVLDTLGQELGIKRLL